jgi:hypothetical protein
MEESYAVAHKYSVILVTLAGDGGNVWERHPVQVDARISA